MTRDRAYAFVYTALMVLSIIMLNHTISKNPASFHQNLEAQWLHH